MILVFLVIILFLIVCFSSNRETYIKISENISDQKPEMAYITSIPYPRVPLGFPQRIPKRIIQTNKYSHIPVKMYKAIQSILDINPEYSYHYFNDDDARNYIKKHFPNRVLQAYDKLKPGAYKADLFRYCVLYKMGGVYIDTGMSSTAENPVPFKNLIEKDDTFICPYDGGYIEGYPYALYNAFICTTPYHPILKKAIEMCVDNIEKENYTISSLGITGPSLLGIAFLDVIGKHVQANTSYSDIHGIPGKHKILFHQPGKRYKSGVILDFDKEILNTKYDGYYDDMKWYHNGLKHYSELWNTRKVFGES